MSALDSLCLRAAGVEDLAQIVCIERDAGRGRWSESSFASELRSDQSRFWVAQAPSAEVVGFIVAWRVLDEVQIQNVGTAPGWQRRGIARRLLGNLLEHERAGGALCADLEVRRSNEAAIALYRSFGFEQVAERAAYYRDPLEDALLLRLLMHRPAQDDPLPRDAG